MPGPPLSAQRRPPSLLPRTQALPRTACGRSQPVATSPSSDQGGSETSDFRKAMQTWAGVVPGPELVGGCLRSPPLRPAWGCSGEMQAGRFRGKEASQFRGPSRWGVSAPAPHLTSHLKALMPLWAPPGSQHFRAPAQNTVPQTCTSLLYELLFKCRFLRGLPCPPPGCLIPSKGIPPILCDSCHHLTCHTLALE